MGRRNASWNIGAWDETGVAFTAPAQLDLALFSDLDMEAFEEDVTILRTIGQVVVHQVVITGAVAPTPDLFSAYLEPWNIHERIYKTQAADGIDIVEDPEDPNNATTDWLWHRVTSYNIVDLSPMFGGNVPMPVSSSFNLRPHPRPNTSQWSSYIDCRVKRRLEREERLYYSMFVDVPASWATLTPSMTLNMRVFPFLRCYISH